MPTAADRRAERIYLRTATILRWQGEGNARSGSGTVHNMSHVGCYVLTHAPAALGDMITVSFGEGLPDIPSEVRYLDADVGMGIAFRGVTPELAERLRAFARSKAEPVIEAAQRE